MTERIEPIEKRRRLQRILQEIQHSLSSGDRDSLKTLINVGEWKEACDLILFLVERRSLRISDQGRETLYGLVEAMKLDLAQIRERWPKES